MSSTRASGPRILVVDDDRALRHAVSSLLEQRGHSVLQAADGPSALEQLAREDVELMLLDIGLPGMTGLDVLARVRAGDKQPVVVVITADDTPGTLLAAVRAQAYSYVTKPIAPAEIVEVVESALDASIRGIHPIEVISARPEWVEIVVPCVLAMADRLHAFILQLEMGLPPDVRESVAQAFRELLCNAIEWGGKLDPSRTVRISCIRARRMLLYRILDPGEGFDVENLTHAAVSNNPDNPIAHALVREEKGIRPGGLGLVMTRALVDELIYNEAHNEVVFIKYLDGDAADGGHIPEVFR